MTEQEWLTSADPQAMLDFYSDNDPHAAQWLRNLIAEGLTTTSVIRRQQVMAEQQSTSDHPFFQPLPEHADLQTAYLLWRLTENIVVMPNGCWVWTGARTSKGYGHLSVGGRKGKTANVHRLVYSLCVGDPGYLCVCHNCPGGDNPACCNPAHLFLGTRGDNNRDAVKKGRHHGSGVRGERHPHTTLTDDQVREIRRRGAVGGKGVMAALAREFHVSHNTISRIVRRIHWSHVTDEPEGEQA